MFNLGDKCVIRITSQQVLSFELCYAIEKVQLVWWDWKWAVCGVGS